MVMEYLGVLVTVGGGLAVTVIALERWVRKGREGVYKGLRQNLGRAILLGLEFLVAADIIRTVAEEPTMQSVAVLGVIVVIRTFLSFTLNAELEGAWPWQHRQLRLKGGEKAADKQTPV